MKIFKKLILFLAALPLVSLFSCTDEEGEGGKATISGIVYKVLDDGDIAKNGDNYSFVRDTIPAPDIDVFVIYGGDQESVYDDKIKTSHNGKFEFKYLRGGDYSVYACNDDDTYVMRTAHCGKKGTTEVEPIYIHDGKNTGKAGIVGNVEILYSAVDDYEAGVEVRVHIRQLGQVGDKDERSTDEGNFRFSCLKPETDYVVWVASETRKNSVIVAVSDTIRTGKAGEIVKCKDLKAKVF
ncbi:MAG: hypothetical protein PUC42_10000 [Bacteroidales bacterium]|jgi:hypothetical protein|nr:hypothetical protein [Bacteroidales bacterium]